MEALFLVAVVGLMYLLVIRPQRRQMIEHQKLVASLVVGDEVITTGGIHGEITDLDETTMLLEVADDVELRMDRGAVADRPVVVAEGDDAGDDDLADDGDHGSLDGSEGLDSGSGGQDDSADDDRLAS